MVHNSLFMRTAGGPFGIPSYLLELQEPGPKASQGYQLSKFTRNRVALTTGYDVVDFEDVTSV